MKNFWLTRRLERIARQQREMMEKHFPVGKDALVKYIRAKYCKPK